MRDNDFKTSCHHMSTCALTGASAFFDAIPGSFMLINGPLWWRWSTERKKTCWPAWIL